MTVRLGVALLLCLIACSSPASEAGLEGANPIKKIEFSEQIFEPMGEWTYSIDSDGRLSFRDKLHQVPAKTKQLSAEVFRETALALARYRQHGGEKRRLAEDCRSWLTDVGSQQVAWVYADNSVGQVEQTNCINDEAERFGATLTAIRRRLDVNNWRLQAFK